LVIFEKSIYGYVFICAEELYYLNNIGADCLSGGGGGGH
jgi:hypothetical protein